MNNKYKGKRREYIHEYNVEFIDGTGEVVHLTFRTRNDALLEIISLILGGNEEVKFYHSVYLVD